jgi:hypothetical protein
MAFWNYRTVLHKDGDEEILCIHRAHYAEGDNPAGRPRTISEKPISVHGEDLDILLAELERMKQALDKPILLYDLF